MLRERHAGGHATLLLPIFRIVLFGSVMRTLPPCGGNIKRKRGDTVANPGPSDKGAADHRIQQVQ
jgi:hypothetical protein